MLERIKAISLASSLAMLTATVIAFDASAADLEVGRDVFNGNCGMYLGLCISHRLNTYLQHWERSPQPSNPHRTHPDALQQPQKRIWYWLVHSGISRLQVLSSATLMSFNSTHLSV
jgi:hypothetical protein